jgi:hypothetical protein
MQKRHLDDLEFAIAQYSAALERRTPDRRTEHILATSVISVGAGARARKPRLREALFRLRISHARERTSPITESRPGVIAAL